MRYPVYIIHVSRDYNIIMFSVSSLKRFMKIKLVLKYFTFRCSDCSSFCFILYLILSWAKKKKHRTHNNNGQVLINYFAYFGPIEIENILVRKKRLKRFQFCWIEATRKFLTINRITTIIIKTIGRERKRRLHRMKY